MLRLAIDGSVIDNSMSHRYATRSSEHAANKYKRAFNVRSAIFSSFAFAELECERFYPMFDVRGDEVDNL